MIFIISISFLHRSKGKAPAPTMFCLFALGTDSNLSKSVHAHTGLSLQEAGICDNEYPFVNLSLEKFYFRKKILVLGEDPWISLEFTMWHGSWLPKFRVFNTSWTYPKATLLYQHGKQSHLPMDMPPSLVFSDPHALHPQPAPMNSWYNYVQNQAILPWEKVWRHGTPLMYEA